jgi:ABC-type nickel/cobalt efflux system permease component RcnA
VVARGADRLTVAFEGLVQRYDGGALLALVGLLGAVVLGAAHAVAPGHGKTVMAFYLSGHRDGALRSAATVGATVTATHTVGVLALGLLVSTGTTVAPAGVYPWLTAASGLLVVAAGMALLRSAHRGGHPHLHGTGTGQHTHQPDPRAHSREHRHPQVAGPTRGGLVAMGLAGGLVPSPSALLVFLAALGLGHPWFGVGLVVAFGVGMATTLAVVGLLVMRLRERAERRVVVRHGSRLAPLLRRAPLATAVAVVLLGAALACRGLIAAGALPI